MKTGNNYFLDILSLKEARSQGLGLNSKIQQVLYKKIEQHTNVIEAKNNSLFSPYTMREDLAEFTHYDIISTLNSLQANNLIVSLFFLKYSVERKSFDIIPVCISQPENKSIWLSDIFDHLIDASLKEIFFSIDAAPLVTEKEIWNDLNKDYSTNYTDNNSTTIIYPAFIQDYFKSIASYKFEINVDEKIKSIISTTIEEKLIKSPKCVFLKNYGIMPLRKEEILLRFKSCEKFINESILPELSDNFALHRNFEKIKLKEKHYYSVSTVAKTEKFTIEKAKSILEYIENLENSTGTLALQALINLENEMEDFNKEKYIERTKQQIVEIKKRIFNLSKKWQTAIIIFDEKEKKNIISEAFEKLIEDDDLLYVSWERKNSTLHVFIKKNKDVFNSLVYGLVNISNEKKWHILLMKKLLEKGEEELKDLFKDKSFVKQYGNCLRLAYIDHMPWYHRFLFFLGITIFQDKLFNEAKVTIKKQQANLRNSNELIYKQKVKKMNEEVFKQNSEIQFYENKNKIENILDDFYFKKNLIPVTLMVSDAMEKMEFSVFEETLKKANFHFIKGYDDNKNIFQIIYYPFDSDWYKVSNKVLKMINHKLKQIENKYEFDDAESFKIRAGYLIKFLQKKKPVKKNNLDIEKTAIHSDMDEEIEKLKNAMK